MITQKQKAKEKRQPKVVKKIVENAINNLSPSKGLKFIKRGLIKKTLW